jgi:uncharacterized protein YaiL (DUF2058 family)
LLPASRKKGSTVKFNAFPETRVFINGNGHLVISQNSEWQGEVRVILPRSVAVQIAQSIGSGLGISDLLAEDDEEDE